MPAALSTAGNLRVVASPNPFSAATADIELPPGGTVLELMHAAGCDRALLGHAHVFIVDRAMTREPVYIPRENWARVRPKPGTMVSIRVVPTGGGGGGGGKSPLRTVLTIAVMVAAFYVGGAVGGLEAFEAFNFTLFGKAFNVIGIAAGALTSVVGNMVVNAIAPIAPPKISEVSGRAFGELTSPTLAITGSQNQIQAGAPVASVLGEARLFPMMRTDAPPYTEVMGNEQFLRQMFDLGYGPGEIVEERIGTTLLSQYEGVESEFRAGTGADAPLTLYTNTIRQDGHALRLAAADGTRVIESRIEADEITGDLSFQGLTTFDGAGNPGTRTVEIKIEYRRAGTGDALTLHGTETIAAATTSLHIHPFRIVIADAAWRDRYEVHFTRLTADNTSTQTRDECTVTALRTVTYTPPKIPPYRPQKAMRIKATNQLNGIVQSYNCTFRRHVPVWDGEAWSEPQFTRNPAWQALAILRLPRRGNAKPLLDSRLDLPAWLAFANRCDQADQNGEAMFRVSGVIDTRGTVREAVNLILATARAWLTTKDGKWSVNWDKPQSVAKQMFTPRNSWGFEYERTFVDLPHALKGKFINPQKDWQQDEVVVYFDGYSEANATEFETIEYFLVDRASQVWRDLMYRKAEALLRPAKYFLNCDIEHLQVNRGDLVRVSNDIMRWGLGEGRIKSMAVDGEDNVTAMTLDEKMTLAPGKSYAARIRKADGTQMLAPVTTPGAETETATLTLTTPIAAEDAPAKGDLVAFGEAAGRETVELLVKGISRLDDLDARLELVDAAPAVHTADQGALPAFDPQQTFASQIANQEPPSPVIREIVSDDRAMTASPSGSWVQGIDVFLAPQSGFAVNVSGIEARFRPAGSSEPWARAGAPAYSHKVRLAPAREGVAYEIELVQLSADRPGVSSPRTYVAAHTVVGRAAPPPKPTTVTLNDKTIDAPGYTPPIDMAGWRVSYKIGDDRVYGGAVSAHPAIATVAVPFDVSHLPAGTMTIFLTAVDTSGNESDPAIVVRDLTGPALANVVETVDWRAAAWPGTIAGGALDEEDPGAGDLAADNLDMFVSADDGAPFVPASDSSPFVPDDETGNFDALVYTATFHPAAQWLPSRLTLAFDATGQTTIDIRTDTEDPFVSADDDAPFVPEDDAAEFVPALGAWQGWPGALDLTREQDYEIRITVAGGPSRGRIAALTATVDVADVSEKFLNFAVAEGGTRLPLTQAYKFGPVDVTLTLLADGGDAISARATIDGAPPGPLIECLDGLGQSVAGRVNASPVKGF